MHASEYFKWKATINTDRSDGMGKISLDGELKKLVDDTLRVAKHLWERGWAERNAGNISADVTELVSQEGDNLDRFPRREMKVSQLELAGRCFFVTATGSRFRDLHQRPEKDLLIIRIANTLDSYHILWGGEARRSSPTSEFISHLQIHHFLHQNDFPQKVIVHTHATHLIALTHIEKYNHEETINRLLWSMHPEIKIVLPEGVGFAPYCCPGSEDLSNATVSALKHHRVVLWEKHGCIAIGNDVFEAFDLIDTVNKAAEIFFICKSAGYEPQGLTDEQLAELVQR